MLKSAVDYFQLIQATRSQVSRASLPWSFLRQEFEAFALAARRVTASQGWQTLKVHACCEGTQRQVVPLAQAISSTDRRISSICPCVSAHGLHSRHPSLKCSWSSWNSSTFMALPASSTSTTGVATVYFPAGITLVTPQLRNCARRSCWSPSRCHS